MQKQNNGNFSQILRKIKSKPLDRELGFGKYVMLEGRMMNSDGSFNVIRQPLSFWDNVYYHLVTMHWRYFLLIIFGFFLLINLVFSILYLWLGMDSFIGVEAGDSMHNFMQAFFFSSQTLTTVGYGHISPSGLMVSFLASVEAFMGLLAFALITGLLYGRFSRPRAKIVFSPQVLVAPYQSGKAIMLRMGNASKSELIETDAQVLLAFNQQDENGALTRRFYTLPLEINKISFFAMSWTIVHALNESSPIYNFTHQDLLDANAEIMVLVKGTDEISQQVVHARSSYSADEIVWNARFSPIIAFAEKGMPKVLTHKVGAHELIDKE